MPAASTRRRGARAEKAPAEKTAPAIYFRQKQSGKEKRVATGFAWDLFLFAGLFGLPLFWRRLPQWGAAVLALWCVDLAIGRVQAGGSAMHSAETALFIVFLGLQLWLGFAGNRLTAKTLLAHGWAVDQPNDAATKRVIERWKLAA